MESGGQTITTQRTQSSEKDENSKLPLQYPPDLDVEYKTKIGPGKRTSEIERDEKFLEGINVRRDVSVRGEPRTTR